MQAFLNFLMLLSGRHAARCMVRRKGAQWLSQCAEVRTGVALSNSVSAPLPFRAELVDSLVDSGIPHGKASVLIDAVDDAVRECISRESWKHPTADEYVRTLNSLDARLDAHRRELASAEAAGSAGVTAESDLLLAEIGRTRDRVREEAQQLEAAVELDMSLERKRREQSLGEEASAAAADAEARVRVCAADMASELASTSSAALLGVGAMGLVVLGVFVIFRIVV